MIWSILIVVIFLGGAGGTVMLLTRQSGLHDQRMQLTLKAFDDEIETKKKLLVELAELSRGLVSQAHYDKLSNQLAAKEERLKTEKGRLAITEAELEAVERRLRDLEELKRELEVSNMEASRELELLKSQQRDIAQENERLRQALNNSLEKLDVLLLELSKSQKTVDQLNQTKSEITRMEKKCEYYSEQTNLINTKYMDLKRAYDALDIEYAQLYERHQSSGG